MFWSKYTYIVPKIKTIMCFIWLQIVLPGIESFVKMPFHTKVMIMLSVQNVL